MDEQDSGVGLVAQVKHLICHVYPKIGGPWRDTIAGLRKRLSLFDGRRVIGIMRGDGLEDSEFVASEIGDVATDVLVNDNRPELREVVTLRPALEIVKRLSGATLFCHTKGATHQPDSICQEWREAMLTTCLDFPALIDAAIEDKPICGPFRRWGGLGVEYHYSGSFFWFRNDAVFHRHWSYVQEAWYGVETFPACNFHPHESRCLFLDHCGDLYDDSYWASVVRPSLKYWRERMSRCCSTA